MLGSSRSTEPLSPPKPTVNAGLRILIAGAQPAPEAAVTPPVKAPVEAAVPSAGIQNGIHLGTLTRALVVAGLVSADLALVGWATYSAVTHKHVLSLWGAAGCTGSILVAALCGAAAVSLITVPRQK